MKRTLTMALMVLGLLMVMVAPAVAADFAERAADLTEITGVRVSTHDNKTRIVFDAAKPVHYKTFALTNPDRVVVDIANAWLSPKLKVPDIDNMFIAKLRAAQHDPSTVRIVVENKVGRNNYKVFRLNGGTVAGRLVLDFGDIGPSTEGAAIAAKGAKGTTGANGTKPVSQPAQTKPQTKTPKAKPQTNTQQKSDAQKQAEAQKKAEAQKQAEAKKQAETQKKAEEMRKAKEASKPAEEAAQGTTDNNQSSTTDDALAEITGLRGRRITIDAGHGGNDAGAIGPTGVTEKSVTLRVAKEVERLLIAEGATVFMTRTTDTEVSPKGANATDIEELQARCDVANNNNSDVFVSIHMDSYSGKEAHGTTGYYYSLGSQRSRELADKIRSDVIDQIGTQSRGTQSCNFYVVKHTDMPATLIEVAFISNPTEEKLMDSEDGIHKAAQGIVDGIADFFG